MNSHFIPKTNSAYARHKVRLTQFNEGETTLQFVTRLRRLIKDCDYGDDEENQIRDEVLQKCQSDYLRRKRLEEGEGLTLERTVEIAEQYEKVEFQLASLSATGGGSEKSVESAVNAVRDHRKPSRKYKKQQQGRGPGDSCYRCGKIGHYGRDPECPARGKTCKSCGGKNHFARVCKTKKSNPKDKVNHLSEQNREPDYAFHVFENDTPNTLMLSVGGVNMNFLIDSGATSNIVDEGTWEMLKSRRIRCTSTNAAPPGRKLFSYASTTPLDIKGSFHCEVNVGKGHTHAEFLVIRGKGTPIIGRETANQLGVLKIGVDVAAVTDTPIMVQQMYPEVFKGLGKLNTKQIELHVDHTVTPVAQPHRRVPFNLRRKVEQKIEELIDLDVIEPVEGPTPCVNPVVVVPKADGDIRLCIDMRRANEAIIRGRYPIPTVDEVLQDMNGSKMFSKLDLKWGYHQLELTAESRDITTFATHSGLYRYKRLLFGVTSASEQYQHEISNVLAGIEGAENISDDIVVHGPDQATHDKRLHEVFKRLRDCGLTINSEKCQYNMDRIIFMGILLSEKGIGPTEGRVKAVLEARQPRNLAELRSFLGLVTYSSGFIPQFATISEPLRRLTRKNTPYEFGKEQVESFEKLKNCLAEATTLAFFKKGAPTKIIADASPVGLGAVLVH